MSDAPSLVTDHVELKKKTPTEWAGPCPECGGEDRFVVTQKGEGWVWYCRGCQKAGDDLAFLRLVGRSCPQAHAELGRVCRSTTCPADRCRARNPNAPRPVRTPKALQAPAPAPAPAFTPATPTAPHDLWRARAEKLIAHAHEALLAAPEPLAYLAGRGLPREAVERYRLGWLDKDRYRPRQAWGLPEELRGDGKPKKLWLPAGLVIPFFDAGAGHPTRIRIRRSHVDADRPRYYWVPGSGNDVPVLAGPGVRAHVVVESDLDALLVHHHAGDRVGAIPLGTAGAKPKEAAARQLAQSLAILLALDFEPRQNAKTGRYENPGGQAARWWLQHYPQAKRWPVPAGKDPGEYVEKHGGDIRAWVLAGLPPAFHVHTAPAPPPGPELDTNTDQEPGPAAAETVLWVRGVSQGGIPYVLADTPEHLADARRAHPDAVPFLREELRHLKGYSAAEAHEVLRVKQAFPDGRVVAGGKVQHAD